MKHKNYLLSLIVAMGLSNIAVAQQPDTPPLTEEDVAAIPTLQVVFHPENVGRTDHFCNVHRETSGPNFGNIVVIVREAKCKDGIVSASQKLIEVLFDGKKFIATEDAFSLNGKALDIPEEKYVEKLIPAWTQTSINFAEQARTKARLAAKETEKYGITFLKIGIFDVSKHTEGTGFQFKVYNPTKKTIKYVTVNIVGLNAVKDPVRDRLKNSTVMTVRGVGPIESGQIGSFSKDYVWMTDLVESFKISNVRVDYMDGSSKTVQEINKARISRSTAEILFGDLDDE